MLEQPRSSLHFLAPLLVCFLAATPSAGQELVFRKYLPDVGHDTPKNLALSPDGKLLAVGTSKSKFKVTLWDIAKESEITTFKDQKGPLEFGADGQQLVSVWGDSPYNNDLINVWDLRTQKISVSLRGSGIPISAIRSSPDGKTIVAAYLLRDSIRLWDVSSPDKVMSLESRHDGVSGFAWSWDGRVLSSGNQDGTILLWERFSNKVRAVFEPKAKDETREGGNAIHCLAFSPDGKLLAAAGPPMRFDENPTKVNTPSSIELWDVATGLKAAKLQGHTNAIVSLSFVSDSKTLVSGSADGTIRFWDVTNGRNVKTYDAGLNGQRAIAVSRDGKTIAAIKGDIRRGGSRIAVWDVVLKR